MKNTLAIAALLFATSLAHAEVTTQIKRAAYKQNIVQKVKAHRWAELETEANRLIQSKERVDDGQWQAAAFFLDLEAAAASIDHSESDADKLERELLQFATKHKTSSNAWLMYTAALNARAWHIRGNGFHDSVTPERWRGFKRYIGQARSVLDAHKDISTKNPAWYAYRLTISMYASEPDAQFDSIYAEGIKLEPTYHDLFFIKMRSLFPIWGGNTDAMIKFTNEAVKQAQGVEGATIYARLAWYADSNGYPQVKESKDIDWSLMKKAFADLLNAYPADWNAQKLFFMACERPDKVEAQRILKYLKEPPSEILLGQNIPVFKMCVDWASGKLPAFAMRDPQTGAIKLIE